MLVPVMLVKLPIGDVTDVVPRNVLPLIVPLALMLLAVMLVKLPIGDVTDVVPCNVLPLIALLALMLLAVRLVKLPIGDVTDVVPCNVLPLIALLALILPATITLAVFTTKMFALEISDVPFPIINKSLVLLDVTLNLPETY